MIALELEQIWWLRVICGKWSFRYCVFYDVSDAGCRPNFKIVCGVEINSVLLVDKSVGKNFDIISKDSFLAYTPLTILRSFSIK